MSRSFSRTFVFALIALGLIAALFLNQESDKEIIERRLHESAGLISTPEGEHPFEKMARGRQLEDYLSEEVVVHLRKGSEVWDRSYARSDFVKEIIAARASVPVLLVTLSDIRIKIRQRSALSEVVASIRSIKQRSSDRFRERIELVVKLDKKGADWLVSSIVEKESYKPSVE